MSPGLEEVQQPAGAQGFGPTSYTLNPGSCMAHLHSRTLPIPGPVSFAPPQRPVKQQQQQQRRPPGQSSSSSGIGFGSNGSSGVRGIEDEAPAYWLAAVI